MDQENQERVCQFAYTHLQINTPTWDIYQECINFIQAQKREESNDDLFIYILTPGVMQQAVQAVRNAQVKIHEEDKEEMRKYREMSEQRAQAHDPTDWNWMELERKAKP